MTDRVARRPRGRQHPLRTGISVLALISMVAAMAVAAFAARPGAVRAQDDAFPTAALAPETALAYVAFSLDESADQWAKATELLAPTGYSNLFQDIVGGLVAGAAGQDELDFETDVRPFTGGQGALVVTSADESTSTDVEADATASADTAGDDGETDFPSDIVVVILPDDPAAAWTKAEELLNESATNQGATVSETDHEGVAIQQLPGDESMGVTGAAIAQVDDAILFAETPEAMQEVIDTSAGTVNSIDGFDAFGAVRDQLPNDFLVYGFFNGAGFASVMGSDPSMEAIGGMAGGLGILGGNGGFTLWADDPGFRLQSITIPAEGQELPEAPASFDPTLDEEVRGDSLFFWNGANLGATGVLDSLALALLAGVTGSDGSVPEGVDPADYIAQQFEAAAQIIGVNLQTDLFQQLVGEFAIAASVPMTLDPSGLSFLAVSEVADEATVNNALTALLPMIQSGIPGSTVTPKDVGGTEIQVVAGNLEGLPFQIELGVVDGRLIIGLGTALEDFVAGTTDSLADNQQYQDTLATLPSEYNGVLYVDLAQSITLATTLLTAFGTGFEEIEDASEKCGEYDSQEAAQAAYDEDPATNFELDADFDGTACEDYFASDTATAEATAAPDYSSIKSFGLVTYQNDDGSVGISAILHIANE